MILSRSSSYRLVTNWSLSQVREKQEQAEHGAGRFADVWFTGFAPADDPRVAVAVVVEDGGTVGQEARGGSVAAPVARQIMEAVIRR